VIKSSEAFEIFFFSYALLKMDRFLLNNNKRYESENKGGTSSTSGKSVKKRKNRKCDNIFGPWFYIDTSRCRREAAMCCVYESFGIRVHATK
jgi:hypothetical protein